MHQTQIITLILSAIISYLLTFFGGFPYLGVSISGILISITLFFGKKKKVTDNYIWLVLSIILSLFIAIRANSLLISLNFFALSYSLSLLLLSTKTPESAYRLPQILFVQISAFTQSILGENSLMMRLPELKKLENEQKDIMTKKYNFRELTKPIGLSFLILIFVIPLLEQTNPIFKLYVKSIFDLSFILEWVFDLLGTIFSASLWIRLFLTLTIFSMLGSAITFLRNKQEDGPKFVAKASLKLLIPKITIVSVLIIYFVAQIQFYLTPMSELEEIGYNYGSYNNEIFLQMSVISILALILNFYDKSKSKISDTLSMVLSVQGIFLVLIALKADISYMQDWGLTFKRLYGIAILAVIAGYYLIYNLKRFMKFSDSKFIKFSIIHTILILIIINLVNFDAMIFRNPPRETDGIDYEYFEKLSDDAGNLVEINGLILSEKINKHFLDDEIEEGLEKKKRICKIRDFREFNLSKYLACKNLD